MLSGGRADRGEERTEYVNQAIGHPELLVQALQFRVHADEESVHGEWVEYAVGVHGQAGDERGRACVAAPAKLSDHLGPPDEEPHGRCADPRR